VAWSVPWNLLGISLAGDVGGYSTYTDRYGKKIVYPFSPPKEPPSEKQVACRAAFRNAQQSWASLTADDKASLELACHRTAVPLTGQNLWIHAVMTGDSQAYLTIQRQSGVTLPSLP